MPLLTWALVGFSGWCIVAEFHRGARVVAANRGVGYLGGLSRLVARNRRRYGGYVVHLGAIMFFLGVAGMAYRVDAEAVLAPGEALSLRGYEVTYVEPLHERRGGSDVFSVRLAVARGGQPVTELRPEFKLHDKFPEPEKDVAVHATLAGDLYAILAQPVDPREGGSAKIQILWNPLVTWVWWSSYVLIFGTVICAWPDRRERALAQEVAEARAA
jgi:cytochrome c-type biogenesis protein CcmF